MLTAIVLDPFVSQRLGILSTEITGVDLDTLAGLLDDGTIEPVVDRTYALHETPEAIRHVEAGHARGKVVVRVPDDTHRV
jgi:NADPH:quinone reductase-like Zn-dependent oxidoreductase